MNVAQCLIAALALLTGGLAVYADGRRQRLFYVAKPLATALILSLAQLRLPHQPAFGLWIVIGLLFSLAGDILLMLPRERFVLGLASFFIAQGCYLVAFTSAAPLGGTLGLAALYLALWVSALTILWPRTGALRWPVMIYATVIVLMAWRAMVRHQALLEPRALWGAIGAGLFCASDLALAWRRFVRPSPWLARFCLSAYYLAQLLIALSI